MGREVWLTEDNTTRYPFRFNLKQRVESRTDGRKGVIDNARFESAFNDGGSYSITYYIQADTGELFTADEEELAAL